jgi:hypothetical protein
VGVAKDILEQLIRVVSDLGLRIEGRAVVVVVVVAAVVVAVEMKRGWE